MSMGREWNKNGRFGLAVDFIGAAMKGLMLFSALLLTGFWGYQWGYGSFQPWLYLLAVPFVILLAYIYHKWTAWRCAALHMLVLAVWTALSWLSPANQWAFVAAGVLAVIESLAFKFLLGDTDAKRHIKRFKLQGYYKWGVMIWISSVLLYAQSAVPSEDFPLPLNACGNWITAAFIVYLILIVMFNYMFQQYDYFRQRTGVDQNTFRQLKRMNSIVAVLVSILITLAMFGAAESLVALLSKLFLFLSGSAAGGGLWLLTKIGTSEFLGGDIAVPDSGAGAAEVINNFSMPSEERIRFFFGVGLIVLLAAALYVLWKVYKNRGANYTIGDDEAVYIPLYEEKELMIRSAADERINFGNDNRGRIRRAYYKTMNRRMDKGRMDIIKGKTPRELAGMYGKPIEGEKLKEMTAYYEKARYSDEVCTDTDVEKMKELTDD